MTDEFIGGLPIGFGPRVPMIICSPWTRGGFVDSNTYDHTSMLRFLETWTGVQAPNITAWRRSVTGDLTAAFDFANPDFSIPALPDTVPLITQSDAEKSFPAGHHARRGRPGVPGPGDRHPPAPAEPATMPHADVTVNRVRAHRDRDACPTPAGRASRCSSSPTSTWPPRRPRSPSSAATSKTYTWTAAKKNKYGYAFSIYGPDGFVRSFAGDVVAAGHHHRPDPAWWPRRRSPGPRPSLQLTLGQRRHHGRGLHPHGQRLRGHHPDASPWREPARRPSTWPVDSDGYYDVIITANTSDGFTRRYAGDAYPAESNIGPNGFVSRRLAARLGPR